MSPCGVVLTSCPASFFLVEFFVWRTKIMRGVDNMNCEIIILWFNRSMKINAQLVLIAVALGGAVVGFFGAKVLPGQDVPEIQLVTEYVTEYVLEESGEKVVPEELLPVPRDLLLNPVFYEWTANVDGVLVGKTSNSVILEKDGKRFSIEVSDRTTFLDQRNTGTSGGGELVSLQEISIGVNLRGSVFVFDQREAFAGSKLVVATGFIIY